MGCVPSLNPILNLKMKPRVILANISVALKSIVNDEVDHTRLLESANIIIIIFKNLGLTSIRGAVVLVGCYIQQLLSDRR